MRDSTTQAAGRLAAACGQGYAILCLAGALLSIGLLDRLTGVLLVLSTFLFAIVARYSARYLMGDPGQQRFTFWLCLTGTFVFALILAGNLLNFAVAWCGISLSLHQLLQFYKDRPAALLAARKKFLISRVGDAALIAALLLTQQTLGTWDFEAMFAAAGRLQPAPASIGWIGWLLAFAALLKSAQFPFHSWLPDTMETPTPVSALMHAGVINAGGILVIRLHPLIALSDAAMTTLCVVGGFTALFASTVMLTQASIKRCLAFSTVAQMGFMMLECGLGAFHLALLHLVAHSLYKAHAFLSSGSAVQLKRRISGQPLGPWAVAGGLLAAVTLSYAAARARGVNPLHHVVLNLIFTIALAQLMWSAWEIGGRRWKSPLALILGGGMALAYFGLEGIAGSIVNAETGGWHWSGVFIAGAFLAVAVGQTQLPRLSRTSIGEKVYVHARNGFYLNTLANRFTASIWPTRLAKEEM